MQMYMNCSFKNESLLTVVGFGNKTSVRKIRRLDNSPAYSIISDLWVIWNMHVHVCIGEQSYKMY